jgi:hypothetical protein
MLRRLPDVEEMIFYVSEMPPTVRKSPILMKKQDSAMPESIITVKMSGQKATV